MSGEDIPYGPEQKPWKETVAQVAMLGEKQVVSSPSKDPKETYNYPGQEKGVTPRKYQVPSIGLNTDQAQEAQDETFETATVQTQNFLAYQVCLKNDYSTVAKYITTMPNNIGDPFYPGAFVLNTKWMEQMFWITMHHCGMASGLMIPMILKPTWVISQQWAPVNATCMPCGMPVTTFKEK